MMQKLLVARVLPKCLLSFHEVVAGKDAPAPQLNPT